MPESHWLFSPSTDGKAVAKRSEQLRMPVAFEPDGVLCTFAFPRNGTNNVERLRRRRQKQQLGCGRKPALGAL